MLKTNDIIKIFKANINMLSSSWNKIINVFLAEFKAFFTLVHRRSFLNELYDRECGFKLIMT